MEFQYIYVTQKPKCKTNSADLGVSILSKLAWTKETTKVIESLTNQKICRFCHFQHLTMKMRSRCVVLKLSASNCQ